MEDLPAISELLPHRGPALMIRRLLSVTATYALAEAVVSEGSALVRPGGAADPAVALELVAQAGAALVGAGRGEGPAFGAVARVADLRVEGLLRAGEPVVVEARRGEGSRHLRWVRGEVRVGDATIAAGEVQLVVGEGAAALARGRATADGREGRGGGGGAEPAAIFELPPSHGAFSGHFPGAPVLPAAVIVALAAEAAGGPGALVARVARARFGRALRPGASVAIRVAEREGLWEAAVSADGEAAATIALVLRQPGGGAQPCG